jgi:hypothetical protein
MILPQQPALHGNNNNKIAQSYTKHVSCMILKGNFKRCRIQNCLIGDAHANQLAAAIRENPTSIQTFSLNKCPNLSPAGITELLHSLRGCTHLTKLELSKVFLDDTSLQELVSLLRGGGGRRRGGANNNQHCYSCWPKLKDLSLVETTDDMAEEPTCVETWQAFFHAALNRHPALQSLDLTLNDLDSDHMDALADELGAFRTTTTTTTTTSGSADEGGGQDNITKQRRRLPSCCGLDSLVLSRNPIGDEGLKALCRGLTTTSSCHSSSSSSNASSPLSLLSLGECSLTDLSPLLECHRSKLLDGLERLYLYANPLIDEAQTKQLQEWIQENFEQNEVERERERERLLERGHVGSMSPY